MIPDFTDQELETVRDMIEQRYQQDIELHLADSELLLTPNSEETVTCPTLFWHARGANFVVCKTGMFSYRTQFFYTPHEQYGTGIDEYDDIAPCVGAVLQMQSDHERELQGVTSGNTGQLLDN